MRQTSQCVGRVLRSKYDYGLMVFADKRYKRKDYQDKLPHWIRNQQQVAHMDMPTDVVVSQASAFFKEMGQPFTMPPEYLFNSNRIESIQLINDKLQQQQQSNGHAKENGADQNGADTEMI